MLVAVLDDRWFIHSYSIAQPDDSVHYLAPFTIRNTDGHRFYNSGDLVQNIFHLSRIDILTTGDNHILHPIYDVDETVRIHVGPIARSHPAIAYRFRSQVRLLPVAQHNIRTSDADLADLAARHLVTILVADQNFNTKGSLTH